MKKNSHSKKTFYFIAVILIFFAYIFAKINFNQKKSQPELSERAKEFLESQNMGQEGMAKSNQLISTTCFEITLPIAVRNPKSESALNKCVLRATLDDPHALITISVEHQPNLNSLEDYAGVKMRLVNNDVYTQENFIENDSLNQSFFSTKNELTYFSLTEQTLVIISLHDLARNDEQIYEVLKQLISALEIK